MIFRFILSFNVVKNLNIFEVMFKPVSSCLSIIIAPKQILIVALSHSLMFIIIVVWAFHVHVHMLAHITMLLWVWTYTSAFWTFELKLKAIMLSWIFLPACVYQADVPLGMGKLYGGINLTQCFKSCPKHQV